MSSGNHAQATAYAASLFGISATVVMPNYAAVNKIQATKDYGANVVVTEDDLVMMCQELQRKYNVSMVHPFDDPYIIAGQGTIGLEILEDLPEVEAIFIPVGGGGLLTGIAAAIKQKKPSVRIVGVEPVGSPSMRERLKQNKVVNVGREETIADGLIPGFTGELNLALAQRYVDEIVLVSDEEIMEAMCLILEQCKILSEPSAAASFAALLYEKTSMPGDSEVVCVLSGANIDRNRLCQLLDRKQAAE